MDDMLKRLKDAVAYLKGKRIISYQKDIVEKLDMNKATVSQALNGNKRYLTESFLGKFCEVFPDINLEWLLTGQGNMSTSGLTSENTTTSIDPMELIKSQKETIKAQSDQIEILKKESERLTKELEDCKKDNFFKNEPVHRGT